ncbi:MAG TPA: GtrA family protein [Caulobacteraceae bacterium]|jgi:putative flippase GtrA|nr:GtrA family protein [Caulobacteraceae bacterium]
MRFDRIPRYVMVGALCAGLYNLIMIAGDAAGVNFVASTCLAFVVNVLVGYTLHCRFTFSEPMSWRGLARYTAAMLLNLPLSIVGIWLLNGVLRLPMWLASPAVTAFLFCWNYVATHWAVVSRVLTGKKGAQGHPAP